MGRPRVFERDLTAPVFPCPSTHMRTYLKSAPHTQSSMCYPRHIHTYPPSAKPPVAAMQPASHFLNEIGRPPMLPTRRHGEALLPLGNKLVGASALPVNWVASARVRATTHSLSHTPPSARKCVCSPANAHMYPPGERPPQHRGRYNMRPNFQRKWGDPPRAPNAYSL